MLSASCRREIRNPKKKVDLGFFFGQIAASGLRFFLATAHMHRVGGGREGGGVDSVRECVCVWSG